MRVQWRQAGPLAAALVWALWVLAQAFVVPGEKFVFAAGALHSFPFWRDALIRALGGVAGAALVLLCAWGAGRMAIASIGNLFTEGVERHLFQLALGFAISSYGLLAIAFAHAYRPAVVRSILFVGGAGALVAAIRGKRTWPMSVRRPSVSNSLYLCCTSIALAFALAGALAPETEYDALWYHLWLPIKWIEAGRPVDIVEEYVSLYPLTWEMQYGAAITVGGPIAAKLLHFACLPLVALASSLLTRRLFPAASGPLAAALVVTTPIVLYEATTAYIDLALTLYVSLAIYGLVRHEATSDRRWLLLAAAMMGVAAAIKHLALVVLAIAVAALFVRESLRRSSIGRGLRAALCFAAIALVIPAPWYVRAAAASGNPVFPDLYAVFGARPAARWSEATEVGLRQFKEHFGTARTPANLARLPWDMTVHAARFGGTLGPAFLILIPAALIRRRGSTAAASAAGFCFAYLAFWASPLSSFQMRFVIPIVPLLAALAAEGVGRLQRTGEAAIGGGGVLVSLGVASLLIVNLPPFIDWHERDRAGWNMWLTHVVREAPAGVVLGAEPESSYLARAVPSYRAWQFINSNLPPDSRVLTFSGGDHLYSARARIWSDSAAAREATWNTYAGAEATALKAARRLGVTHLLVDRRLAMETASGLAIASDRMRACCLSEEYADDRFVLYRLNGTGTARSARPDPTTITISGEHAGRPGR